MSRQEHDFVRLFRPRIGDFIQSALREDIGEGDHTSLACIDEQSSGEARLFLKQQAVIAGIELAGMIFQTLDPDLRVTNYRTDGEKLESGVEVLRVNGKARSILTAERLVLNCMQRMSGIASLTRAFKDKIAGTNVTLLDTRKTTPGFRLIEKWAVQIGGATNHRFGLYDMILIKDNHIDYCGGVGKAVQKAISYVRSLKKEIPIVVEARTMEEVKQVLQFPSIRRILLDNFAPSDLKEVVRFIDGRIETEASGGITLANVREYAETGVQYISTGALTHSYQSVDMSLKAHINS